MGRYNQYTALQRYGTGGPVVPPVYMKGEKTNLYFFDKYTCEGLQNYNYVKFVLNSNSSISADINILHIYYDDGSELIFKYSQFRANTMSPLIIKRVDEEKIITKIIFHESAFKYIDFSNIGKCANGTDSTNFIPIDTIECYYFGETINLYQNLRFANSNGKAFIFDISKLDLTNIESKNIEGWFEGIKGNFYIKCTYEVENFILENANIVSLPSSAIFVH